MDSKTHLPVRITTQDKSKNVTTVDFKNTKTNEKVNAKVFVIDRIPGYQYTVKPLGQK